LVINALYLIAYVWLRDGSNLRFAAMTKGSAKKFLQQTQPDAWEVPCKSAIRLARRMAKLDWAKRAALFNEVLGIIAHQTIGDPQRLFEGNVSQFDRNRVRQFVASGSAVLAGLLLELSDAGEDIRAAAASPYCALLLASCPIDAYADVGLAHFKVPGGLAQLDSLLDQFPNFRTLAAADISDRTGRIVRRAPTLQ
jgi:hypothetical protein